MLVTAEVRQLGFHDLRRSHASLLAHAGVSTAVTQKLMRHSDPKLTERVYTLVDVETLRREVERLDFKPLLTRLLPERSENAPQARSSRRERKKKSRNAKDLDEVTPARFERATCGLGNRRSIQLSYGALLVRPPTYQRRATRARPGTPFERTSGPRRPFDGQTHNELADDYFLPRSPPSTDAMPPSPPWD